MPFEPIAAPALPGKPFKPLSALAPAARAARNCQQEVALIRIEFHVHWLTLVLIASLAVWVGVVWWFLS